MFPDLAAAHLPFEGDVLVAGAIKQQLLVLRGKLFPGRLQIDIERLRYSLVDMLPPAPHTAHAADERERAIVEGERWIGDEQFRVERMTDAQAIAIGAHAVRAIETEKLRARRLVAAIA